MGKSWPFWHSISMTMPCGHCHGLEDGMIEAPQSSTFGDVLSQVEKTVQSPFAENPNSNSHPSANSYRRSQAPKPTVTEPAHADRYSIDKGIQPAAKGAHGHRIQSREQAQQGHWARTLARQRQRPLRDAASTWPLLPLTLALPSGVSSSLPPPALSQDSNENPVAQLSTT